MPDRWPETLHCSKCRTAVEASLTQEPRDETPTVQDVPEGFKAIGLATSPATSLA